MMVSCGEVFKQICSEKSWCKRLIELIDILYPVDDVHGVQHVMRVTCMSLIIAKAMEQDGKQVDYDILLASSMLHDIGRRAGRNHHALISAKLASYLLVSVGFPAEKINSVLNAIKEHSFSLGLRPSSIESCILSDADKLDALGAIGIYRVVAISVETRRGIRGLIKHFEEKLSRLINLLCTDVARAEAQKRLVILSQFVRELEVESKMTESIAQAIREVLD